MAAPYTTLPYTMVTICALVSIFTSSSLLDILAWLCTAVRMANRSQRDRVICFRFFILLIRFADSVSLQDRVWNCQLVELGCVGVHIIWQGRTQQHYLSFRLALLISIDMWGHRNSLFVIDCLTCWWCFLLRTNLRNMILHSGTIGRCNIQECVYPWIWNRDHPDYLSCLVRLVLLLWLLLVLLIFMHWRYQHHWNKHDRCRWCCGM